MTAEAAIALPALFVVLAAGIWGLQAASLHTRCIVAARSAALASARGETDSVVAGQVRQSVEHDAQLVLSRSGRTVTARVSARGPAFGALPGMPVEAIAVAELEPEGPP